MKLDRFSTILRGHDKAELETNLPLTKKFMAQCNNQSRKVYNVFIMTLEAQSHSMFPFFLKKGVNCIIHAKVLDPPGRYVILKAGAKDKMTVTVSSWSVTLCQQEFAFILQL